VSGARASKPRKGLPAVWRDALRDSSLDNTAKAVGFVLSTFANASGYAYPSRETLARGASLGLRTVDAAISSLEAAGFVLIERSRGRSSHRYTLTLPATAQELRRSEWTTAQELQGKPRSSRHATVQNGASNRAGAAGESSKPLKAYESGLEASAVDLDELGPIGRLVEQARQAVEARAKGEAA
jgi:Helix-turn-helix domain